MVECFTCGKPFTPRKRKERIRSNRAFCSRRCFQSAPQEKIFWTHVRKAKGCWLWAGSVNNKGYGLFANQSASKVAWVLTNGEIPNGLEVCHDCPGGDNPLCVNPAHLFLGTHSENLIDSVRKGKNRVCKLTIEDVVQIRKLYATGEYTYKALGDRYGTTLTAIWSVVARKSWAHVP